MTRKPLLSVIALVTLLSLALTGCGKKQEQTQSTKKLPRLWVPARAACPGP